MSPSLKIKYIFLSFLQQYFSSHSKYPWNQSPKDTKIIITDKFAIDLGVAAIRPSIILDRGPISWTNNYRNEAMPDKDIYDFPVLHKDRKLQYTLTDQMQSSITLNIMSKMPFQADELANEVFINISGYREWFKEKGIHKFTGLGISKENVSKLSSADIEVTNVSIQMSFIWQQSIKLGERLFNCRVYDEDGVELFENIDFRIKPEGNQILVAYHHEGKDLTIDYIDAITLEENLNKNLISDSQNSRLYTVPDNGVIYGYYKIVEKLLLNKDNDLWIESS